MGKTNNSISRRTVLMTSAASITGISLTGIALGSGSEQDQDDINTDFKPGQKEEIKDFVLTFIELDESKQNDVWNEINNGQKRAYADALRPRSVSVERLSTPQTLSTQSIGYDYDHVHKFKITGAWDSRSFSLIHQVKWSVEDGDVTEFYHNGWTDDRAFGWADEGNIKTRVEEVDRDLATVESTRGRRMSWVAGPYNGYNYRPETKIAVSPIGMSGVTGCDDDGIGDIEYDHDTIGDAGCP